MPNSLSLLVLSCVLIAGTAKGQESRIQLPSNITLYYDASLVSCVQLRVHDNVDFDVDLLRNLRSDSIRDDVGLDLDPGLRLLLDGLEEFETRDKWRYYSPVVSVSQKSKAAVEELRARVKDVCDDGVVSELQFDRIAQIRNRFSVLGDPRAGRSYKGRFREALLLEKSQVDQIAQLGIASEIKRELTIQAELESVREIIGDEKYKRLCAMIDPFAGESCHPCIALAHCRAIENLPHSKDDLTLEPWPSAGKLVLVCSGRLCPSQEFLERTDLAPRKPWQEFLFRYLAGEFDWLEAVESQARQLSNLRSIRELPDGSIKYIVFGFESLSDIEKPAPDWSAGQYESWEANFSAEMKAGDEQLGQKISEILLPHQLDAVAVAFGIENLRGSGVYHFLLSLADSEYELSKSQISSIERLMKSRAAKLEQFYFEHERQALKFLDRDQRAVFDGIFGGPTKLYPGPFLVF